MNPAHIVALVIFCPAILGSLVLLRRSGETRVALLFLLFVLVASAPAAALWGTWGEPLVFEPALDAATARSAGVVATALLCLALLLATSRTLAERDRIEALHWNTMEAVRALGDLAARDNLDLDAKRAALLEIGCTRLRMPIGVVSRVVGQRYVVEAVAAPERHPLVADSVFHVDETWCGATLASERTLARERIRDDAERPAGFRFGSYVGAALRVQGRGRGTLFFASPKPRGERFTASEKDVVRLMAAWLASEMERHESPAREKAESDSGDTPPQRLRRTELEPLEAPAPASGGNGARPRSAVPAPRPRVLDVNGVVRRVAPRVQRLAGDAIDVGFSLAEGLPTARAIPLPLDTILLSLVARAVRAMPRGGRLEIRTAGLEMGAAEPGALRPPSSRFVTLSVEDTGNGIDAESLAHIFEASGNEGNGANGPRGELPLASVYHLLQRHGGDLSVDVRPDRGTRLTVYLPLAPAPHRDEARESPRPGPKA